MFNEQQSTYTVGANSFVDTLVVSNLCTAAILLIILGVVVSKCCKTQGLNVTAKCPRRRKNLDRIDENNDPLQQEEVFHDAVHVDPEMGNDHLDQDDVLDQIDPRLCCNLF